MPSFFTPIYNHLFEQADQLKKDMDAIAPQNVVLRQNARKALHDFLSQYPEMGPQRYFDYLNQDGPDRQPFFLAMQPR